MNRLLFFVYPDLAAIRAIGGVVRSLRAELGPMGETQPLDRLHATLL